MVRKSATLGETKLKLAFSLDAGDWLAKNTEWLAKKAEMLNEIKGVNKIPGVAKVLGKTAAPITAIAGGWEMFTTYKNRRCESGSERNLNYSEGFANMAAGGLGTAALIIGESFPPVLAATAVAAGTVALGIMVYKNRTAIGNAAKTVWRASGIGQSVHNLTHGLSRLGSVFG